MATAPEDRTRLMDGYGSERVQRKKRAFGLLCDRFMSEVFPHPTESFDRFEGCRVL